MTRHPKPIAAALALLCMAGCVTPRTTTLQERQAALATLNAISATLIVLQANGTLEPEKAQLGLKQVEEMREAVMLSAEQETDWVDVMGRISNLALQWAVLGA